MKKVFVDTNILLDMLLARKPHNLYSEQLFELGRQKKVQLVLSCLSIANAQYILKNIKIDVQHIRTWLVNICSLCELVAVNEKVVMSALTAFKFEDIEDAIQYMCAMESCADVIITRNKKDFKPSQLPVMSAEEFCAV
jgi:predicted nucleic acid-binding protein